MADALLDALDNIALDARLATDAVARDHGGGEAEELAAFVAMFKVAFHLGVLIGSSYIGPAVVGRLEAHNHTDMTEGVNEIRAAFAKGID